MCKVFGMLVLFLRTSTHNQFFFYVNFRSRSCLALTLGDKSPGRTFFNILLSDVFFRKKEFRDARAYVVSLFKIRHISSHELHKFHETCTCRNFRLATMRKRSIMS